MRSLRMKLILIMVLLIVALMTVVGSFLINGVESFYANQFYNDMERAFSTEFIAQMQNVAAQAEDPVNRLRELLMAQSDLAIDLSNRNVYVLDPGGQVLAGSNDAPGVAVTVNLTAAMSGRVGQSSSIIADYMDVAIPVTGGDNAYIVYVLDNKTTVNALTGEVITIILESLALGLVISVVLAVLLAQILIRPIQALTAGARQVAEGSFPETLDVASRDEIGTLTQSFNDMSQILQNTLSQVNNERNKLSTLFLHMTDGVVAFDGSGQVIHSNPAAETLLDTGFEGLRYEDLFADIAPLSQLLALRRPEYIESQRKVADRDLELFLAPFSDAQAQGGVLAVIHDVTVQRRNEEMSRAFVANVSHELRTPLTNVRSYTETILDSGEDLPWELEQNFLNVVLTETDRMTRIVQDLLTLSRFDSGRMELNMTRFPFGSAVRNVYQAVTMSAQEHRHTLHLNLAPNIPKVEGDQQRIEQVIMNILSNAIKYTPDGGEISISAGRDPAGDAWVNVTDNGIGIPEEDIPRLFERFYRVDKARSRESGGTGLGLSIALEILNLHQGKITVDSKLGQGTSVTITLPAAGKGAGKNAQTG